MQNIDTAVVARKASIKKIETEAGVKFDFGGVSEFECRIDELGEEMTKRMICHAIKDKVGDTYSGVKGDMDLARFKVEEIWKCLTGEHPQWSLIKTVSNLTIDALVALTGKPKEEVMEAWKDASEDKRKAWKKNPKVVAWVTQRKLEMTKTAAEDAALPEL